MSKTILIGGGLSGLSAAIYLSQSGEQVELIEASPKLGGRTYSFFDNTNNTEIDNGQHILMGAYNETIKLLKIMGSENLPIYQKNLKINFIKKGGRQYKLSAPDIFYPINLLSALLKFNLLSWSEKLKFLNLLILLFFSLDKKAGSGILEEWLEINGQSPNSVKSFWEILCVGALNTKIDQASVEVFKTILKKLFFTGNKSSVIILPNVPLSELFIRPAVEYLRKRNVQLSLSEKLTGISCQGSELKKLITEKREITDFDNVVLAIPPSAISKIDNYHKLIDEKIAAIETSPIITIHLWMSDFSMENKFAGLINGKIQWIFENKGHFSIVISAADELINFENEKIYQIVKKELSEYFPGHNFENITSYRVIKEKRATFKSNNQNQALRKKNDSKCTGLYFAGDWTNTNLPGTIEGAILSGRNAALQILA